MKHLKLILIFIVSFNLSTYSQTDKLLSESQTIKTSYDNLLKNLDNKEFQKRYIVDFPDNIEIFKKVFQSPTFDQLYMDSHLYIFKLAELSKNFSDLVGDKLIRLCIGLKKWDADAIGHIQHVTMGYANSNYSDFIGLIKKLNNQDLNTLVTFLADVENHSAYGDYQGFMNKLKTNMETELFDSFKKAKELRISQKDHGF
ncbi:hypothetical protein EO244_13050 [Ancylomarina salipaludis]|uniref:Uncharacterized protein n=1 Tax=Ancylomarina salipaludis TaxID=2501299 RepID=A0A4Q1JJF0_9BACT|nr:hypothetical protein [Ancylomarina salipaludis]RXQ91025.1 hypothetical protein EO244_13050 [Ancylomarina salipaludis]